MGRASPRLFGAVLTLALASCSKSEAPASAAPVTAPVPSQPLPEAPPEASAEDNTVKLSLVSEPEYATGEKASLKLLIEPRGGYHINQEYPVRVSFTASSGVLLAKASLQKADAAEFGEKSARFEVPFQAERGQHQLLCKVDFAVCTAETCVPDEKSLAVVLNVK